jgi:hypothetical protein
MCIRDRLTPPRVPLAVIKQNATNTAANIWQGLLPQSNLTAEQQALSKLYDEALAAYSSGGSGVAMPKPVDMRKQYAALKSDTNAYGAGTLQEMLRLSGQAAQTATGIGASGEKAASALQKIYGDTANASMEAARMAGTEGAGMRPVSGADEDLVRRVQATGANMSDYLRANQLIDTQTAGFMSELNRTQSKARADEFARADYLFKQADMAKRQAAYEQAVRAARAASAGSAQQNILGRIEILKAKQGLLKDTTTQIPLSILATADDTYGNQWDDFNASTLGMLKAQGITTREQYIAQAAQQAAKTASKVTGQ